MRVRVLPGLYKGQRRPHEGGVLAVSMLVKESNLADKKASKKQNAIQRFIRETVGELRKVSWPTRQEAWQLTVIVLVVLAFMSIFLGIIVDGIVRQLLYLMLGI